MNIGEVVDYVYRIVPKLQAHLTAMQSKIVENAADLLQKVDKSLVEKMFEKFQAVIGEIRGRVDELKNAVEQTATREEINEMLEEILNTLTQERQTTVGRMK
jgi:predicted sugar kinase